MQRSFLSFIKNGKECKDWNVLLKRTDAQPCPRPDPKELNYPFRKALVGHIVPNVGMPFTQHVISNFAGECFKKESKASST